MPERSPTPEEIACDPELACLAALQATLDVTRDALVAGHLGDNYSEHPFPEGSHHPPPYVARCLITLIGALEAQVDTYRKALRAPRLCASSDEPF